MSAPLQLFSISTAFSALLFAVIFLFLSRDSDRRYMALWALSLLVFGVVYFLDYIYDTAVGPSYLLIRFFTLIVCANLFLAGTCDFFGVRFSRLMICGIICAMALTAVAFLFDKGYERFSIPLILYSSFIFVCAGLMFMLYSWTRHVTEKYIASFIIIVMGIYNVNLPFHSEYPPVVLVNYTIGLILLSTLGVLLLIVHFKKGRFQLARQEAHYRLLVENAAGIILLYMYAEKRFRYVSPSAGGQLGATAAALYGDADAILDGLEGEDAGKMRRLLSSPPGGPVNFIFSKRLAETKNLWYEIYATPVYEHVAAPVGIECIISNITERMDMLDSLKRAEQARKELVEDLSHELRTPLTIIQGYTETLLKDRPADVALAYLEIIDAKTRTLNTLLEELIQTSMFSSRQTEYKFYEINAVAYLVKLTDEIRLRVENENRRFSCENSVPADTLLVIDRSRIDQVISNVVGNALKFTPPGRRITFVCSVDILSGSAEGRLIVRVRDSGAGIPVDDLQNIFRRRYSGLSGRSGAGSGLGLYISREIVNQHGGQIWAENNSDGGATISFYLPCHRTCTDGPDGRESGRQECHTV
jgi:signal transduction histidine kinase